ncbi:hypothetical protein P4B35_20665 [Pontiellaceae bacterium B12227]|nr:hypothetical protein [Pontiellaceae bacterium B12227]
MRLFRQTLWMLLLLCSLCRTEASVFRVTGEAWNNWVAVDGLQWEKAYDTEMIVNGRRQVLHLYCARYTEPVFDQLASRLQYLGAAFSFSDTDDGFSGIAKKGDFEVRILVSSPKSEPRHYIFLTYPEPGAKKNVKVPVKQYPKSTVQSTVDNLRTRTAYATLKTSDQPIVVYQYYDQWLTSQGWNRMLPDSDLPEKGGALKIYKRKDKVCYIQVRQGTGISSIITLLVKNGTI